MRVNRLLGAIFGLAMMAGSAAAWHYWKINGIFAGCLCVMAFFAIGWGLEDR